MSELRHISEPIAGFLHSFGIEKRRPNANPVVRRYRFACECEEKGDWRRDVQVAIEDGTNHQDDQA